MHCANDVLTKKIRGSVCQCAHAAAPQQAVLGRREHNAKKVSFTMCKFLQKFFDLFWCINCGTCLIRLNFKVFYQVLTKHGSEASEMVTAKGPVHRNRLLLCYCMASLQPGESEPSSNTLNNLAHNSNLKQIHASLSANWRRVTAVLLTKVVWNSFCCGGWRCI